MVLTSRSLPRRQDRSRGSRLAQRRSSRRDVGRDAQQENAHRWRFRVCSHRCASSRPSVRWGSALRGKTLVPYGIFRWSVYRSSVVTRRSQDDHGVRPGSPRPLPPRRLHRRGLRRRRVSSGALQATSGRLPKQRPAAAHWGRARPHFEIVGSRFSGHPHSTGRIGEDRPLEDGVRPIEALSSGSWFDSWGPRIRWWRLGQHASTW
jgi:hypothetical protein